MNESRRIRRAIRKEQYTQASYYRANHLFRKGLAAMSAIRVTREAIDFTHITFPREKDYHPLFVESLTPLAASMERKGGEKK